MASENGNTIKYRVERLEKSQENYQASTNKKLDLVLNNHLPHINEELIKIRAEIKENRLKLGIIIGVATGAISILVQLAFKLI